MILSIIKFLGSVPELLEVAKSILKMFEDIQDKAERKKKIQEFVDACLKAKTTKDSSDLERLFRGHS